MAITTNENDIKERLSIAYVIVSVSWSLTKPDGEAVLLRLRREDAQTLTEAYGALIEEESTDTTVQGVILQLNNDLASFDGSVVILAPVNGGVRRVRVRFVEADRPKVFEAGQNKLGISVKGELIPSPSMRDSLGGFPNRLRSDSRWQTHRGLP